MENGDIKEYGILKQLDFLCYQVQGSCSICDEPTSDMCINCSEKKFVKEPYIDWLNRVLKVVYELAEIIHKKENCDNKKCIGVKCYLCKKENIENIIKDANTHVNKIETIKS